MNILHMKYAVEVANLGSLNKAADSLLIAQPNLSRSIKELENSLGITIFQRSSRGMTLTPDGEELIGYARKILEEIDQVENLYKKDHPSKQRFSVTGPRASYISHAFVSFSKKISAAPTEIFYKETNAQRSLRNILNEEYKLGILRYASSYDRYYRELLAEKDLSYEILAEFHYRICTSRKSTLNSLSEVHFSDLAQKIEIAHADPYVPSLSLAQVKHDVLPEEIRRRIFVFERGSQFELLEENPDTYIWVSPLPQKILDRFGLVELDCPQNQRLYRDVLIHKNQYQLTELDQYFVEELIRSKEACFNKGGK